MPTQNNNMTKEDWSQKDRREYFAKAVNSMLMTDKDKDLDEVLKNAKKIVDTAFEYYPDQLDNEVTPF